jgi:hypothetical protein
MNAFILMLLWIGPPFIVLWLLFRDGYHMVLKRRHDRILYTYCEVRDSIALKALDGEISESSELFKFFYETNAEMIHQNKDHGWCYVGLFRKMNPWRSAEDDEWIRNLEQEIESSSEDVKKIVSKHARAMCQAMVTAMPFMLKDAIVVRILKIWSHLPLLSKESRKHAEFNLDLARASGAFA